MVDVKCLKCKTTTENTYAIQCCKCSKWMHTKCVNMTKNLLNSYEKELKNPNGKRWFCQSCEPKGEIVKRPSMGASPIIPARSVSNENKTDKEETKQYTLNDVMKKLDGIDLKYENLLQKYEEQSYINKHLEIEINQLKQKVEQLEQKNPQNNNVKVRDTTQTIEEINDREYRKKNLVVFAVAESDSDETEERRTHDTNFIKLILEAYCPEISMNGIRINRIGTRQEGKDRPVKVIMTSEEHVGKVFRKVKEIRKDPLYSRLGFSNDRTKQQINEYRSLKEELMQRTEKGEENLIIKYIRGVPKIIKQKN